MDAAQEVTPLPTTTKQQRGQGAKSETPTTIMRRQQRQQRRDAEVNNVEIIDKILT